MIMKQIKIQTWYYANKTYTAQDSISDSNKYARLRFVLRILEI